MSMSFVTFRRDTYFHWAAMRNFLHPLLPCPATENEIRLHFLWVQVNPGLSRRAPHCSICKVEYCLGGFPQRDRRPVCTHRIPLPCRGTTRAGALGVPLGGRPCLPGQESFLLFSDGLLLDRSPHLSRRPLSTESPFCTEEPPAYSACTEGSCLCRSPFA